MVSINQWVENKIMKYFFKMINIYQITMLGFILPKIVFIWKIFNLQTDLG